MFHCTLNWAGNQRRATIAIHFRLPYIRLRPIAVDESPDFAGGVLVLQDGRKAGRADGVEALELREAADCGGKTDGGETGVTGGGVWPAVVHDRDDQKSC